MKRFLTLALVMLMALSVIPAYATAVDPSTLPEVEFDWYFGQTEMPDAQMVNDAVNEYLLEKINAKVRMHFWLAADFETKMTTMISSGQDVGVIGFGSQTKLDYVVQSQRGAYYPLDDLLDQYGQGTRAIFGEDIWDAMRIDGHIYGIPSFKDNGYFMSIIYNEELLNELGLSIDDVEYSNFRDIEEFLYEAKAKRDELYPEQADRPVISNIGTLFPYYFAFETFLNDSYLAVCNIEGIENLAGYDHHTAVNFYGTQEFLDFAVQKQRMVDDGIYAYDYTDKNEWNYDGVNLVWPGWGYVYMQEHLYGDVFTTRMKISDTLWTDTNNFYSAGTAISANCKEYERAMMMLELVNTDSDFATMMRFGVEGQHYVIDEAGNMEIGGERNSGPRAEWGYYYWYMAPIGNLAIVRAPEGLTGPDNYLIEKIKEYNESCYKASHLGFTFVTDAVKNEIAACTSIVQEYQPTIARGQYGSEDEVREAVAEFNDKLLANGSDKIVEEVQRQLDEWNAAKGA